MRDLALWTTGWVGGILMALAEGVIVKIGIIAFAMTCFYLITFFWPGNEGD